MAPSSYCVLLDTRAFDGYATLHIVRNYEVPNSIVIVEQWDSREHYDRYLAWRTERATWRCSAP